MKGFMIKPIQIRRNFKTALYLDLALMDKELQNGPK